MRKLPLVALFAAGVVSAAACTQDPVSGPAFDASLPDFDATPNMDAAPNAVDGAADAPPADAPDELDAEDANLDAPAAVLDAAPDANPDAAPDATPDAAPDASACAPGSAYYVDPAKGSDVTGMGGPSCPFATVAHALSAVGAPAKATDIVLLGDDPSDTVPLMLDTNIRLMGAGAPPVITATNGLTGVILRGGTLTNVVLDGKGTGGLGIVTNVAAGTARIDHVTVRAFAAGGIDVSGGAGHTAIGPGVHVLSNAGTGLGVGGDGHVDVTGGVGADETLFSKNATGARVNAHGTLTVTANAAAREVVIASSTGVGIIFSGTLGAPDVSRVTGLVVEDSGIDGMQLAAGSRVVVRSSRIVRSKANGVLVFGSSQAGKPYEDTTGIDLGAKGAFGKNVLQLPGVDANTLAGICLSLTAPKVTLPAEGNVFATGSGTGTVDCTTATAPLSETTNCASFSDIGVATALKSFLDVAGCKLP